MLNFLYGCSREEHYNTELLYRDTMDNVGWKPYLTFDFVFISHQFSTTPLLYKNTEQNLIQKKIWELYNQGMTYTKIHRHLVENGYDISSNRTTVDFTIKKRINRERILNQQTLVDTYVGFGVEVLN